jgi:hypothetical protein
MVTDNTPQLSGLFGVYLQVGDLDRSLRSTVTCWRWSCAERRRTGGAARPPGPRRLGGDPGDRPGRPAQCGRSGVTRVLWHAEGRAELDSAEELLTRQQVPYQRHRDVEVDGITMHDPDGLEIVLLWIGEKVTATGPPAWLYWYH